MTGQEAFSSIDFVYQCLIDEDKVRGFDAALKDVVSGGSVLDLGTGSGILALLAARNGAKQVQAIEIDPFIAEVARKNIVNSDFSETIAVINADARSHKFNEKFDVVLMEMLSTGMVDEFQVQAFNNLHAQGAISATTTILPRSQTTNITLVNSSFLHHGFEMKMVSHLWSHDNTQGVFQRLSKAEELNSIHFSSPMDEVFKGDVSFTVEVSGKINAILLESVTQVSKNTSLGSTHSLNPQVLVPVADKTVAKGDEIMLNIVYEFGAGYQKFKAVYK